MEFHSTQLHKTLCVDAIVTVHYFEYTPDFFFPGEAHDFWEFVYVDKGEVDVTQGTRTVRLRRGQIAFHAPMEFHSLCAAGDTAPNLVVVSFVCHSPAMQGFMGQVLRVQDVERDCLAQIVAEAGNAFSTPLGDPATRGMERREEEQAPASEQLLGNALERLLLSLLRRRGETQQDQALSTARANREATDALHRVILYLQAHARTHLSLETICRENLIGRSRLQKLFHQRMGCGVIAYFRQIKAEVAKEALRRGDRSMEEIADFLGYASAAYFSRDFKKCTGMTPTEYSTSAKLRTMRSQDAENFQ